MPTQHNRTQRARPQPNRDEHRQETVTDEAAELLVLWRAMSAALARDSAGQLTSDRQPKGAREGSAATVNVDVVDAAVRIETGVTERAAEAVRLLNLDRGHRSVARVLEQLPEWHRALTRAGQPLAEHMAKDLGRWLRDARQAIGVQRRSAPFGLDCPDHRDTDRTELRVEGAKARIADSLLDGPPADGVLLAGPACRYCTGRHGITKDDDRISTTTSRRGRRRTRRRHREHHDSCEWILDRRLVRPHTHTGPAVVATDWVLTANGPAWSSLDAAPAFEWSESGTVLCPHCRRSWTTPNERRILAAELKALGDRRSASMDALIR